MVVTQLMVCILGSAKKPVHLFSVVWHSSRAWQLCVLVEVIQLEMQTHPFTNLKNIDSEPREVYKEINGIIHIKIMNVPTEKKGV